MVWVKWHTPSTPQSVTITVSVSGAYTAQDTFVAEIVDLNEHIPPDPTATDTNPNYTVPSLPNEPQKLTANWVYGAATGYRFGFGVTTMTGGTGSMKAIGSTSTPAILPPSAV